jgi:hypothetical protein
MEIFMYLFNPNPNGWGRMWLLQLWRDSSPNSLIYKYFSSLIYSSQNILELYLIKGIYQKIYFRQFFNQNLKASTCLWWCFCIFQPAGRLYDSQATNRSVAGEGGLSQGVLTASYWSPWSRIWLPASWPCTFLYPFRLGSNQHCWLESSKYVKRIIGSVKPCWNCKRLHLTPSYTPRVCTDPDHFEASFLPLVWSTKLLNFCPTVYFYITNILKM